MTLQELRDKCNELLDQKVDPQTPIAVFDADDWCWNDMDDFKLVEVGPLRGNKYGCDPWREWNSTHAIMVTYPD